MPILLFVKIKQLWTFHPLFLRTFYLVNRQGGLRDDIIYNCPIHLNYKQFSISIFETVVLLKFLLFKNKSMVVLLEHNQVS